jgi:hypothetical protein
MVNTIWRIYNMADIQYGKYTIWRIYNMANIQYGEYTIWCIVT